MRSKPANNSAAQTGGVSRMLPGLSLAEMLVAMTIAAMVLVAVLSIYNRAERSAAAVMRRLDYSRTPREILQRIAEDLDRVISSGSDATITIQNKRDKLFPTARLAISRTFRDRANREQTFEEIIWQASHDFESFGEGLVLYRSHSGVAVEDKVINKNKENWEKELFVPLCGGVTFFRIRAFKGEELVDKWSGTPPAGIEVAISFAEPYKKVDGTLDVPDEEKIVRTIAVDRSRTIKFQVTEGMYTGDQQEDIPVEETPADEKEPVEAPKKTEKVKR